MSEVQTPWIPSSIVKTDMSNVAALPGRSELEVAQSTTFDFDANPKSCRAHEGVPAGWYAASRTARIGASQI